MPYTIVENDAGKWCVYKKGEDGGPEGETLGCHDTQEEAQDQIAAIETNEAEKAAAPEPEQEQPPEQEPPKVIVTLPSAVIQVREGRVLSARNRQLIADAVKQSKEAVLALQKLLEETEPEEREEVVRSLQTVRAVSEDEDTVTVAGYGLVWGGRDLYKTFFTPKTDLWLDKLGTRHVVLYDHGFDHALRKEVVGESAEEKPNKVGLWVAAQLYKHNEYLAGLQELMKQGALGWSSGAVGHLAEIDQETGEVKTWPIVEWSLTPTPAEPRTLGVQELRALAKAVPAVRTLLPKDGDGGAQASNRPSGEAIAPSGQPTDPKSQVAPHDGARRSVKMSEQVLDMEALANRTAEILLEKQAAQAQAGGYRIPADQGVQPSETPAFRSLGEFMQTVARSSRPGATVDPRLLEPYRALGMNVGVSSEGGFLVGETFAKVLLERIYAIGEILPRCNHEFKLDPGTTSIKVNYIDETSRANGSRWGGILAYWAAEAASVTATKPKIGRQELELQKLFALMYASDEMLRNAAMLETTVKRLFPQEMAFRTEDSVFCGTGAGMPLGILNAPATIVVAKEGAQANYTIVAENVINMWSRLWGPSRKNAVWFVGQDAEVQLPKLSITVGGTAIPMYLPANGLSGSPYSTLFTRPVIPCEYCNALGTKGDIILADLGEYALIDQSPIRADSSIHVEFLTDQTAFRWIYYVEGQPMWHAPLTPKNQGPTQSPFVVLADRK